MKSTLLVVLSAAVALAWFGPNIRIDHQNSPPWDCTAPVVTVGPGAPSSQPVYVAFEAQSGSWASSDVMFQKSTDAGRTWLAADVLIRRGCPGAFDPDITTDSDGDVYVVFGECNDSVPYYRICCVQSTDGGATWSQPTTVYEHGRGDAGWAQIAADSAGTLFCAWNDNRTGSQHVWSSVSTDRGATWSQNVRVCDDSMYDGCCQADVFVQPGTNHYLVAAETPYPGGNLHSYLYRSTDMGQTFQPGVRLDTSAYSDQPHVVADAQHVICGYVDYASGNAEARTLYTQPDTWGAPHFIGHSYPGPSLAMSADGRVHTALMAHDSDGPYHTYYAFSSDHGVSWSDLELVNDDTTAEAYDPDIGADSPGHAYIVWRDLRYGQLWFATNNPAGIAEETSNAELRAPNNSPTVVRGVLLLPQATGHKPQATSLMDASGRRVMELKPGANDVRGLTPGVYFVRGPETEEGRRVAAIRKVVVTR